MNKFFLFVAFTAYDLCYAGSGSVSDGELAFIFYYNHYPVNAGCGSIFYPFPEE
jgi:hypothetical protein